MHKAQWEHKTNNVIQKNIVRSSLSVYLILGEKQNARSQEERGI